MAVVWTFDVPDAGTRRVFSTEDKIWNGQTTSVSATVGRALGANRGVPRQMRTYGSGLGNDFKAASLQKHFWAFGKNKRKIFLATGLDRGDPFEAACKMSFLVHAVSAAIAH